MNYIELINHFWQTRRRVKLSSKETDLYFFLLQESNIRHWENPFECSNVLICATIGITEKSLIDVRNRLRQKGLILFEAGQRKKKSPVYTLLAGKTESKTRSKSSGKTESKKQDSFINQTKNQTKPEERESRFAPPSLKEVYRYFVSEKGISENEAGYRAGQFYNFYDSKNWMVGRNKMSNWKAAAAKSLDWEDKRKNASNEKQYAKGDSRNQAAERKAEIVRRAAHAVAAGNGTG